MLNKTSAKSWRDITLAGFDERFDGKQERCYMSFQFPKSGIAQIVSVSLEGDSTVKVEPLAQISAISSISVRATREHVWDLLVVKPDHRLALLTHGLREIPIEISGDIRSSESGMVIDMGGNPYPVVRLSRTGASSAALSFANGCKARLDLPLYPKTMLTTECFAILSQCLTHEASFLLHRAFLDRWIARGLSSVEGIEFNCLTDAIYTVFQLKNRSAPLPSGAWERLARSTSHQHFGDDPVLLHLRRPPELPSLKPIYSTKRPSKLLSPMLYALHTLAEYLRLLVSRYDDLIKLVPLIRRIALEVRPEWADYWQRLVPDTADIWPVATESRM